MHVKSIKYERLFNIGNFEHIKVGMEIEVEKNDDFEVAYNEAKDYVDRQNPAVLKELEAIKRKKEIEKQNEAIRSLEKAKLDKAKEIMISPEEHSIDDILESIHTLEVAYKKQKEEDDLPF